MADGLCNTLGSSCNATEWRETIRTVNMLPEVFRAVKSIISMYLKSFLFVCYLVDQDGLL